MQKYSFSQKIICWASGHGKGYGCSHMAGRKGENVWWLIDAIWWLTKELFGIFMVTVDRKAVKWDPMGEYYVFIRNVASPSNIKGIDLFETRRNNSPVLFTNMNWFHTILATELVLTRAISILIGKDINSNNVPSAVSVLSTWKRLICYAE